MILGYEANIGLIYYGPKWSWAEMVMGRNGHGPKWLWAEMTRNQNYYKKNNKPKIIIIIWPAMKNVLISLPKNIKNMIYGLSLPKNIKNMIYGLVKK